MSTEKRQQKQDGKPAHKKGWYSYAFRTKEESDRFSNDLAQSIVDTLNKNARYD